MTKKNLTAVGRDAWDFLLGLRRTIPQVELAFGNSTEAVPSARTLISQFSGSVSLSLLYFSRRKADEVWECNEPRFWDNDLSFYFDAAAKSAQLTMTSLDTTPGRTTTFKSVPLDWCMVELPALSANITQLHVWHGFLGPWLSKEVFFFVGALPCLVSLHVDLGAKGEKWSFCIDFAESGWRWDSESDSECSEASEQSDDSSDSEQSDHSSESSDGSSSGSDTEDVAGVCIDCGRPLPQSRPALWRALRDIRLFRSDGRQSSVYARDLSLWVQTLRLVNPLNESRPALTVLKSIILLGDAGQLKEHFSSIDLPA